MKHAKKLICLLLALAMVLGLATTAFAAQEGELDGGSITINDAVPGETYSAYQILYLESYNVDNQENGEGQYAYKANSGWDAWLRDNATAYLKFDDQGYVTWVDNADAAAFAALLKEQLTNKTADATATAPAANEGETYSSVTISNLNLGYYLVDTTLGTLCSLDTTNPTVTMEEKNVEPTVKKQVKEDTFGDGNTAKIGDTVEFQTTIHAQKGARNYKLHDQMEAGLTLVQDTNNIIVKVGKQTLTEGPHYIIAYDVACTNAEGNAATCDFEITFVQDYLDTITAPTDIVVTYSAILNGSAEIFTDTNDNTTKLDFGNASHTAWDTTTKTFSFDIVKTDSDNKLLNGAEFELYNAETDGDKINLVKDGDGYRPATPDEQTTGFESAVIEVTGGKVTVKGLDSATYWLQETKAPDGYNKLPARVKVEITDANLTTSTASDTCVCGGGRRRRRSHCEPDRHRAALDRWRGHDDLLCSRRPAGRGRGCAARDQEAHERRKVSKTSCL